MTRSRLSQPPKPRQRYPDTLAMLRALETCAMRVQGFRVKHDSLAKLVKSSGWDAKRNPEVNDWLDTLIESFRELQRALARPTAGRRQKPEPTLLPAGGGD